MLNKLFALLVRGGITFGIAVGVAFTLDIGFNSDRKTVDIVAYGIMLFGAIYAFSKFNQPFGISVLEDVDEKIHNALDEKSKHKIEDDMLRLKNLLDSNILTQDEYEQKINILKKKYL